MLRRLSVLILLLTVVGCGSNVAPVSGKITLDDKPLANATVIFMPESDQVNPGPGSKGKTNKNGEYSLELMSDDIKGAIIGKHKVSITAYEGDSATPSSAPGVSPFQKILVPDCYNGKTILSFDVQAGGSTSADFHLKSDPSEGK